MGKYLVLTGGSIKGSFAAGAISEVLRLGFKPDAIYGVSVGSLNAAFLVDRAAYMKRGDVIDWEAIGNSLELFWLNEIRNFDILGNKNSTIGTLWKIVRKKFNAMLDMDNLDKLIKKEISTENIKISPIRFKCGFVNILDSRYYEATNYTKDIHKYIMASTRIPIIMPAVDSYLYDGGVRNIAPLKNVLEDGATEVVVIACQPVDMAVEKLNTGSLLNVINRILGIMCNEALNEDINSFIEKNERAKLGNTKYKYIPISVIRPEYTLDIDLEKFSSHDIGRMLELGRRNARDQFKYDILN